MRVEVFREQVRINIRLLKESGPAAVREFYRIALASRMPELKPFEDAAWNEGIVYTKGVDVLSYDESQAVVSLYLDVEDETKAVYLKMLVDPVIKS